MNFPRHVPLRGRLAAAVCTAFAVGANAGAAPIQADIPRHWLPGDHTAVAELFHALDAKHKTISHATASTLIVSSCADDGSPGTLRSVVTGAGDGDVVDLSSLACGAITLVNGAIPVYADSLTIKATAFPIR